MFRAADFVNGFVQILCDMKAVIHNSDIRDASLRACLKGLPHIHADCLDPAPLLTGQGFPQLFAASVARLGVTSRTRD